MRASIGVGEHSGMEALIWTALPLVVLALGSTVVILGANRDVASLPRPGDATVTTAFILLDWPREGDTVVNATVANPGTAPVLVGASLRRRLVPGRRPRITVPRRTSHTRYRPVSQAAMIAVPGGAISKVSVPVPDRRRRYRLIVIIGQSDDRLSVFSTPLHVARPIRPARVRHPLPSLPLR
jgi:hypothetical protein